MKIQFLEIAKHESETVLIVAVAHLHRKPQY